MPEKKLIITPKRFRGESDVISIRLPLTMLSFLDDTAKETGRTRNDIILKCLCYAIDNMEDCEKENGQ